MSPTPTIVRLATGNPGKRPIPVGEPQPGGPIERPARLKGRAAVLWDTFIARAFWLTWADGPKAFMWCQMYAEFEKGPSKMIAGRIAQLRVLGSELGFDPTSRARMGTKPSAKAKADPAQSYFTGVRENA